MQIHILAIGDRMPDWVNVAYAEYARRLPHECRLTLHEIPAGKRSKGADLAKLAREEGERLRRAIPAGSRVVALDRTGQVWDTAQLAERLAGWMQGGSDVALLVGGPEGLSPEVLAAAQERWSLSRLTFAHPVVRVVLAEQLYRAWSIISNKPYHR